jgi:hypothetical protein
MRLQRRNEKSSSRIATSEIISGQHVGQRYRKKTSREEEDD